MTNERGESEGETAARHDHGVLRELARRVAETAAQPIQEERRRLCRTFHRRQPVRPMTFCASWRPSPTDTVCMGFDAGHLLSSPNTQSK